jgi:hypothetical protein
MGLAPAIIGRCAHVHLHVHLQDRRIRLPGNPCMSPGCSDSWHGYRGKLTLPPPRGTRRPLTRRCGDSPSARRRSPPRTCCRGAAPDGSGHNNKPVDDLAVPAVRVNHTPKLDKG